MKSKGAMREFDHQLGLIQRIFDALIVACTLIVAKSFYQPDVPWSDKYTILLLASLVFFYVNANISGLYRSYRLGGFIDEVTPLFLTWVGSITALLLLGYALKVTHELSRVILGLWSLLTPVFLLAFRAAYRKFLDTLRERGYNTRSVAIVGTGEAARDLAINITHSPRLGLNLLGFISAKDSGEIIRHRDKSYSVIGDLETLFEMAGQDRVDVVYIALPTQERETISEITRRLGDSTVSMYLVPDFYTAEIMQGGWVHVGSTPTINIIDNSTYGIDSWIKRMEDVVFSLVALAILALPMFFIAIAVKLSSPGPVLYRQRRYGFNGRPITVWKFRTMTVTEDDNEFVQAKKQDKRITPLGAFLRRTSLDELPQFFNVLAGDMSVVGPRPHAVAHNEQFRGKLDGYMLRHKAKPGITGLAQINGYRGETDTDDKMADRLRQDVEYIHNWSIWLDLAIILKTPFALLRGENAH